MSLTYDELEHLTNQVLEFIPEQLMKMNQQQKLEEYLIKIGFKERISSKFIRDNKNSKILIIGESSIKDNVIESIFREYGISKTRIEAVLDYEHAKNYNFSKLEWNMGYGAILFGPIPHSLKGKKDFSSIIAKIENDEGYPESRRLIANGRLKISKNSLRNAIEELINKSVIHQNIHKLG